MTSDRRSQLSWAFYDWANSAFATTVLVGLFPVFFNSYYAKGVEGGATTFYLGVYGNSAPALLVMLLAPGLGVLADRKGWKKELLAFFTLLGVCGTAGLFFVGEGQWQVAIALFALAAVGFFGGLGFYDSLLVDVSPVAADRDRVSAFGYGLGYLGGGVLFLANVAAVLNPQAFGLPDATAAVKWSFVSVAVWWALFSLPLFLRVRERRESGKGTSMGWGDLGATIRRIAANKPVWLFLVGYWLYIDAVGTVAVMAADFGVKLGFKPDSLIKAILIVQFVSFPAAVAFGRLAGVIGAKRGIYCGLVVYIGVTLWALRMETEVDFYLMATAVGLVQGGVQSLSRSYFSRLIPQDDAGQYFGFYNMLGKFAAVLGPLVVGVVATTTGNPRLAVFSLIFFFVAGMLVLSRVREPGAAVAKG